MGLDVGVVRIDYSRPPRGPAYDFAWYLFHNGHEADWGFSKCENTLSEYSRVNMLAQVDRYMEQKGLRPNDRVLILNWVHGLPWDGDTVMLHLGW